MAKSPTFKRLARRLQRFTRGATNALELIGEGRLGAPYQAPFDVVVEERRYTLRHYGRHFGEENGPEQGADGGEAIAQPLLLVPPLMVTSEVYDISPELSAVSWLGAQGVDVWLIDFGPPETLKGGMERTLDDHIQGVDKAITEIKAATGQDVHLTGYSQGGMFCYQVAAYRRSKDVASVITFGSPVDIHRNLPAVADNVAERFIRLARSAVDGPLKDLEGLPGFLTSRGFKLLAPRQELKHLIGTLGLLHDRDALEAREPRRRFLGGEGFIAWPGPAFREFVDQVIVDNRMKLGGIIVAGHAIALSDITCPVLFVVGLRDDMARPAAVRAIVDAAPNATLYEAAIPAGHFGLVVGSKAMTMSWPLVVDWMRFTAGDGDLPELAYEPGSRGENCDAKGGPIAPAEPSKAPSKVGMLYELATDVIDGVWHRMGDVSDEVGEMVDALRWQLPRLSRLESLKPDTRISISLALAEQAASIPDQPFFLWHGMAYTYAQADARVGQLAAVLYNDMGIRRGQHVGVLMANHPDYLTTIAACSRIGAVAALLNAGSTGASLKHALKAAMVEFLVTDLAHMEAGQSATSKRSDTMAVLMHAGEAPTTFELSVPAANDEVVAWLPGPGREIRQTSSKLPDEVSPNPGLARDLALLMFTSGTTGMPKAARITNRRWAVAALGAAATCRLTPRDTVYCCLPLHHSTGQLVAVGGALIGGSRLALSERFSTTNFWSDVRRVGATVVFYVGELCRYLVKSAPQPSEKSHPVRLFVGNGMRPEVWKRLLQRFGPLHVIEFYGATEGNAFLANLTGDKVGSVGRVVWHNGELAIVRQDATSGRPERNPEGRATRSGVEEPGLLLSRVGTDHPAAFFDGYVDEDASHRKLVHDVFESGDQWFNTGDLMRVDADGDYWFVDRVGDTFRWKGENVATEQVASVVGRADAVALVAVYGIQLPNREGRAGMAAIQLRQDTTFDGEALYRLVQANLFPAARPRFIRCVPSLELTDSLKVKKARLADEGADPGRVGDPLYYLDAQRQTYTPMTLDDYHRLVAAS